MADSIIDFWKVKDVKFCKIEYSDNERDIEYKIGKSEKQIIILNDLSSPSPSVQMYLECITEAKLSEGGGGGGGGGTVGVKPLNYVFVRHEDSIKKGLSDLERGSKNRVFKTFFKDAIVFPAAAVAATFNTSLSHQLNFFGHSDAKLELFHNELLKGVADFDVPEKKNLFELFASSNNIDSPDSAVLQKRRNSLGRSSI